MGTAFKSRSFTPPTSCGSGRFFSRVALCYFGRGSLEKSEISSPFSLNMTCQDSGAAMIGDRSLFAFCPACGNVIRFSLPPKGGIGIYPRCRLCETPLHFPARTWKRSLGLVGYIMVCLILSGIPPLCFLLIPRALGIILIGLPPPRRDLKSAPE
jgi:hypothetical protein